MEEYLSAAEAKKITRISLERQQVEFLDEIMPRIKQEAEAGKSYMHWYKQISKNGINALTNLGYKIDDHYDQRDGYTYKISW